MSAVPDPDLKAGLDYWEATPATIDGVLGGFGTGTLPRVDALGSRQFAQSMLPYLVTVTSILKPLQPPVIPRRIRALDVGAGIGRVTSTVLLHLVDDVVMVEPISKYVEEAVSLASKGKWKEMDSATEGTKSVTFLTGPLQRFDPSKPNNEQGFEFKVQRLGFQGSSDAEETGYDIVWCQWALGHLSDVDLVTFFQQARKSLRTSPTGRSRDDGLIVVKENLCRDTKDDKPNVEFDDTDSSVTRSNLKWHELFEAAGLTVIREKIQEGLPAGLYEVRMYALR